MTAEEQSAFPLRLAQATTEEEAPKKKKKNQEKEQEQTGEAPTTEASTDQPAEATQATTAQQLPVGEQLAQVFNVANPSWDLFIVVFFAVSALLYGMSLGRDRIIVILVSIYMSLAVVQAVPDFVLNVTVNQSFAFQFTTFVSLFVVFFFLISRSALLRTIGAGGQRGGFIATILFSILHVGLLLSIALSFMPAEFLERFAPVTQTVFTHEWAVFGWVTAPIAAMIIFGKREEEE